MAAFMKTEDAKMHPGAGEGATKPGGIPPRFRFTRFLYGKVMKELLVTCSSFWLRRTTRRKVLLQLAEECSRFGPLVRRKAAELRAEAAQKRLEMLREGDMEAYSSLVSGTKENRLREILDETERILAELRAPSVVESSEVEQPKMLKGLAENAKLMPHQLEGLRWLVSMVDSQMSGILADDMGLGKTVQTLSLLAHLKERCGESGPHLVMVPLSTIGHWADEITGWLPSFKFLVFRGNKREFEAMRGQMGRSIEDFNIVVTTYEMATIHATLFSHYPWYMIVVDEGQRLKNSKTQFSQIVRTFPCRHRLLLTGTPIQNSLRELWSLLAFVAPHSFGSLDDFEQWFALPAPPTAKFSGTRADPEEKDAEAVNAITTKLLSEEEELLIIQRLHRVLRPFLLRRTKEMILKDLPGKREVMIWTPLSGWQAQLYEKGIRRTEGSGVMEGMTYLRQVLNHPYTLLMGEIPVAGSAEDNLIGASGKFELLDRLLPRLLVFGHKMLIFAQQTSVLDLLQLLLSRHGIRCARIDGSCTLPRRKQASDLFNGDPEVGVLLLTTRAGGLGLNLQAADTVILFDSDWNPQMDLQAMDRAHRIGQKNPVLVVRLATPTHLDRALFERVGRKIDIEQKVISAGRFTGECAGQAHSGSDGLLARLIGDARRRSGVGGMEATPLEDVNRLVARTPEERAAFEASDIAILGPAAATEDGGRETVAERLERSGRLLAAGTLPDRGRGGSAKLRPLPKRRRTGKSPAGIQQ